MPRKLRHTAVLFRATLSLALLFSSCAVVASGGVQTPRETPFDRSPTEREAYLQAYRAGHEAALTGSLSSWCLRGDLALARSTGWNDGQGAGMLVWFEEMETALGLRDRARILQLLRGHGDEAPKIADALLAEGS
jgi:hypothetical protein